MFFPIKIVRRREMYPGDGTTYTYYTLNAFWRVWKFEYGRPTRKGDKLSHWMKEIA